ncbi:MAG: DUF3108 domain-containing protein [Calditrichaeota bacterium]|nr:DUF3108 domain-containing protein [Calditrichota bacterium]
MSTFISQISLLLIYAFLLISGTNSSDSLVNDADSISEINNLFNINGIEPAFKKTFVSDTIALPNAFENGEVLSFDIRYGFIVAGSAKMKVFETKDKNERPIYHLQTTARSSSTFSWIYKVRDEVNSYVNHKKFYPYRFEKKLREGGYEADLFTDYFPEDSLAKVEFIRYDDDKIRKRNKYEVTVPPYVQDILSSFYYIRRQKLEVGKSVFLSNHEKKKVYNLEVKVHRKETIEVEAGKFRCIVVEPIIQGEGLFMKKGNLVIWLTDDDKKIPVQMTSEVLVGHITTELTKIEGVKDRITAKLK